MARAAWCGWGVAILLAACSESSAPDDPPGTAAGGAGGGTATGGPAGAGGVAGAGGMAGGGGLGGGAGGSCPVIFSDSFEQGLGSWFLAGANHEQSADFAHTGQYAHKVWDEGTLDEIAHVDFEPPDTDTLYVGFFWLVDGGYGNSPGKLGRLVSADLRSQMEMWCSTDSWSPGIHWYGGEPCAVDPDGLCCRWPQASQETPGIWHRNEVFIEYETPGQADGRFRQWIDRPVDVPIAEADAYLTADEDNTRFMGDATCGRYENLRLPTNIDGQFQGGFIYYDDVEIRGCLP